MHTTCTRTTTTTASGCHPPSTVLVRANNNNNVVRTEGSSTHTARYGSAPLWHRRHRTNSARGRARISSLTQTHKWEENSVQQRPHAGITDHTRHNSDASLQPPTQQKRVQLHALWKVSAMRVSQKSAVTLPFILHSPFTYHLEACSHHSSVPLPVLPVSLHWRKLSPHIPSPCIAERKSTTRHGCGATPPINPRKYPTASCGTGGSLIMPAKGFFQSRTRPHHTPVKKFGPSHAKELSGRTAGKATPAAMSSPHTPTHRCPAYHQK
ncbi:hypothetical protein TCSYLVIO_003018 [Trypanosoma cruzi]|nr:hypothetical protein TCSYLVIO_003018 [Trypanosoma cruzi]